MVRAYQQMMETLWAPVKRKEKKGKQSRQANKLNYQLLKISEVKIDKLEEEDKDEDLFKTVLITNTMKHLHEKRRQARENSYRTKSYASITESVTLPSPTSPSSSGTTPSPGSPSPSTFTPPPFSPRSSSPRSLRRQCRQGAYQSLIYSKNAFEKIRKKTKKGENK